MIQQTDIDEIESGLNPPGNPLIGLAGLCNPGRVIVGKYDRGGVDREGLFDDFPWINARAVNGSTKQLFEMDNTVPVVEIQAAEQLMRQISEPGGQKCFGIGGAADCLTGW